MKQLLFITILILSSFAFGQFRVAEGSEARFYINEVLLGRDKTVIGTSKTITGEVNFD